MAKRKTDQPELVRHDGGLCTHFVKTASGKRQSILSYADLVSWGHRSDVLSSSDAQRLERMAVERPADAERCSRGRWSCGLACDGSCLPWQGTSGPRRSISTP